MPCDDNPSKTAVVSRHSAGDKSCSSALQRKKRRLTLKSEFEYVKAFGRKRAGRFCVLIAAQPEDGMARQAIVISRYYSRKAVTRNRARRILRVALQELLPDMKQPLWLVIRPRQALKNAKSQQVVKEMQKVCRQLNLLRDADAKNL